MNSVIDMVCAWPSHLSYPLFSKYIHENRKQLNKVIVVFTDMHTTLPDLRQSVIESMSKDHIVFLNNDEVEAKDDWRDKAMNKALTHSKADWVWFVEQDFFPLNNFWGEVHDLMKRTEVFGVYQEGRLHPCCLFITRELLDKTSKDFAANPPHYDHFGKLQRDIENKDIITGVIFSQFGYHMNGLSQNLFLKMTGGIPNYEPEKFEEYLKKVAEYESNN